MPCNLAICTHNHVWLVIGQSLLLSRSLPSTFHGQCSQDDGFRRADSGAAQCLCLGVIHRSMEKTSNNVYTAILKIYRFQYAFLSYTLPINTYTNLSRLRIFFKINEIFGQVFLHQLFGFILHKSSYKTSKVQGRSSVQLEQRIRHVPQKGRILNLLQSHP